MIVRATRKFRDLAAGTVRRVGDEFDVSRVRFDEINAKHGGLIEVVSDGEGDKEDQETVEDPEGEAETQEGEPEEPETVEDQECEGEPEEVEEVAEHEQPRAKKKAKGKAE